MSLVIYGIDHSPLKVTPIGNRMYKIADPVHIAIHTSEGTLRFDVKPGLITNFRSGSRHIDGVVDQIGTQDIALIYLVHDLCYGKFACCHGHHPVSRKLGDELLREGLKFYGMSRIKRNIVYVSVRLFGKSAYYDDDELTEVNMDKLSFSWSAT